MVRKAQDGFSIMRLLVTFLICLENILCSRRSELKKFQQERIQFDA
jgi:hypothetical protein